MSDGIENNALFCDFVQENASLVQIQTGLDLLVQYCHHNDNNHNEKTFSLLFPTVIRFLCHAALRVPDSPWSQYTIYSRNNNNHHNSSEDPFATFYLFQALARYILDGCLSCHRTPNIPLARYYSSVLMRCALSYKGISLLTAVREVWHRYATAMVAFDHNTNKIVLVFFGTKDGGRCVLFL
ncbi:hypothetical protein AGDE_12668 [Angomonas deanei]|nr:hypothetical protein AGDE_12668 [Angomonas deanei]|eukprot:EPY24005.1 hypothetical protein AGDE_12668 [Angomonas deanei]